MTMNPYEIIGQNRVRCTLCKANLDRNPRGLAAHERGKEHKGNVAAATGAATEADLDVLRLAWAVAHTLPVAAGDSPYEIATKLNELYKLAPYK